MCGPVACPLFTKDWKTSAPQCAVEKAGKQHEALMVDEEIAHELHGQPPPEKLRHLMIEKGETTLLEKAVREAAHGVISLEEATQLALELSE
jgi:type II secretory ATPase GspE/PulE/Tfp pilus assembly ATPase PilB-like protein